MKNYGTPPPASPIPGKRKQDIFDIIQEERQFDKQQDEAAMLERLSKDCEVTPYTLGDIYFKQVFDIGSLMDDIKTITNDYAEKRGIKPPYNNEP